MQPPLINSKLINRDYKNFYNDDLGSFSPFLRSLAEHYKIIGRPPGRPIIIYCNATIRSLRCSEYGGRG